MTLDLSGQKRIKQRCLENKTLAVRLQVHVLHCYRYAWICSLGLEVVKGNIYSQTFGNIRVNKLYICIKEKYLLKEKYSLSFT